jgi:hypothetical protein
MLVTLILKRLLGEIGPEFLRERMTLATTGVLRGMEKKGLTLENTPQKVLVRDALFRLWKRIVGSGDIADLIRDAMDDAVVARVAARTVTNMADLVAATTDAAIAETFGG